MDREVLYDFKGHKKADGETPESGLMADSAGNLYGTTYSGGANDWGTVFKLAPDGTETVIYTFCAQANCSDGSNPEASLIADKAGNLYGTTQAGGTNCFQVQGCGTVFKVAPDGTENVLYSFCSKAMGNACTDGAYPTAGLIVDSGGNFYGTTPAGGITDLNNCVDGCGVAFKLAPDGTETVLYTFCSQNNCSDGAGPASGLIADGAGNFYGTTVVGGASGRGTIFKLAPDGTETVLYSFFDGYAPNGVVMDKEGNFYGTTEMGGDRSGRLCPRGCGTAFKLANGGTETVLHSFGPGADGILPEAGVLIRNGRLFGTAVYSGAYHHGTVFELRK